MGMKILGRATPPAPKPQAFMPPTRTAQTAANQVPYNGIAQVGGSWSPPPGASMLATASAPISSPTLPTEGATSLTPPLLPLMVSSTSPTLMPSTMTSMPGMGMMTTTASISQKPAYRWYGYGAPTPGANPYAPNGTYTQPSAEFYTQSGATPGAIPSAIPSMLNPENAVTMASATGFTARGQKDDFRGDVVPPLPAPKVIPAVVALKPVRYTGEMPTPATKYVARAQSEEAPAPVKSLNERIADRIRAMEDPRMLALGVDAKADGSLLIRLKVSRAVDAQVVADRISAMPELTSFRIDFEVSALTR